MVCHLKNLWGKFAKQSRTESKHLENHHIYISKEHLILLVLLDISRAREKNRLSVYMDGADARVYRALKLKLGSEERANNAILLTGMIEKLQLRQDKYSVETIRSIKRNFNELVGISSTRFEELLDSL